MAEDGSEFSLKTIAASLLHRSNVGTGGVSPSIELSSTFARDENYELIGGFYSRYGGPTTEHLEQVLARLDGGAEALAFSSGLAAAAAFFDILKEGDHVAAPQIMYFGVRAWLQRVCDHRGVELSFYDQSRPEQVARALRPGKTRLLWVETPANPTWDVVDIEAAARAAHEAGALVVVDSTAAPPCTTRPLSLGADFTFHAATKYLNGHSDLTAGALIAREKNAITEELREIRSNSGGVLPPFEAWLLMRGIRTLFVRFAAISASAMSLARRLEAHPRVKRVIYPGLESHPGHMIAKRQMTGGFGGMMSVLVDGDEACARRVATLTRLFIPATSFGGVESLIEHRKSIEGPDSSVPGNMLRVSVGLEDAGDLIADFEQALEKAAKK
ncbi:MAG TPA: PLP-dependent aspartate aminotransferase family protein [Parvularculaceae bacterium]|nr:PLP-dependent aspartate aminotransferase family protein [Parvularculaceae bacterium]